MPVRTPALALGLLAAAIATPATDAPPSLQKELLASTQALVDGLPTGDKATWQRLLTDDAVLVDEFGRIAHKADTVDSLHAFPPGFSGSIQLRDPHVTQHGDTALLQVEEYEQETVFGQKLVVRYQSLWTYVKQADGWKLAGYADATLPTDPPRLTVANLHPDDYVGTYRYAPTRAWAVVSKGGAVSYTTHAGGTPNVLQPVARDVFMGSDDEKNLLIFHRGADGKVDAVIERRKFNDLKLAKDGVKSAG
jgi:ketosteroid isomerase-like protein